VSQRPTLRKEVIGRVFEEGAQKFTIMDVPSIGDIPNALEIYPNIKLVIIDNL